MALFERNQIFLARGGAKPRDSALGFLAWVLVGVAVALLGAGWINPGVFGTWRAQMVAAIAPVAATVSVVLEPVNQVWVRLAGTATAFGEAAGLRADNARLLAAAARVDELERENADLRGLTRFAGAPGVPRMAARVVARSPGGLSRTLLIGAGRNQGIQDGYPVIGGEGLAGRVVQTQDDSASVLLLGDRLSRVPVYIGRQQARGVLAGTGADFPNLEFLGGGSAIAEGEMVTTSGLGGVFPRGLLVGVVVRDGDGWRVRLAADAVPFTVGVLQVALPALDVGEARAKAPERETAGARSKAVVK